MNLQLRIDLLARLGEYMTSGNADWEESKDKASLENSWFTPEFIDLSARNISHYFLNPEHLTKWAEPFAGKIEKIISRNVGIVMAGNIPMVGFHDLLAVLISGHRPIVKLSSKDAVLIKHLGEKLVEWSGDNELILFSEMLKNCDVYIATGSNNSSRYFDYYFGKFPHIIRRNKTSVAVLTGNETRVDLEKLADDVYQFFGLGCRNVTKIYVPKIYDFVPLLEAFKKYNYLADHHKYRNNYDYNLALHMLNNKYYMTNGSVILVEETPFFSPISQLNYEFYQDSHILKTSLESSPDLQAIVGKGFVPFGQGQCPKLDNYADRVNTLEFLANL